MKRCPYCGGGMQLIVFPYLQRFSWYSIFFFVLHVSNSPYLYSVKMSMIPNRYTRFLSRE